MALRGSFSTAMNSRGILKEANFSRHRAWSQDHVNLRRHHHIGHRDFAAHSVGKPDYRGFGDFGLLLKELLDLARIYVEASRNDQIALAAAQRKVPVGRARGQSPVLK